MSFITKNIEGLRPVRMSAWRKIAMSTWRLSKDPSVYGLLEVDVEPALRHLTELRERSGIKLTLTHYVALVLAKTFEKHPEINSFIRWGKLYRRPSVDIFLQVAMDDAGEDLSGLVLRNLEKKTLLDVGHELNNRVQDLRKHGDPSFKKIKRIFELAPSFLIRHLVEGTGFILYTLNLWSPALNTAKDPFGSAMITNIGSLGADFAFVPIPYYSRCPLIISIGAVTDGVKVNKVTREIEVKKIAKLCITFDHRIIDGVHASRMSSTFKRLMEDSSLLSP